uniref:Glycine N-acyltransferase-like protein n=1 Tax=Coturnix japonica TaxID=93934 RepID=A0A8C2TPN0_COTJA
MRCPGLPSLSAPHYQLPGRAMRILTCPAHLRRLEAALRSTMPRSLPVYGAVLNINRGNPGDFEVAVDAWPDVVLTLTHPICVPSPIPSPATVRSQSHPNPCPHPNLNLNCNHNLTPNVDTNCNHNLNPPHPRFPVPPRCRLDPDMQLGTLNPAHVELLDSTWPYGGNEWSRRYLGELLLRFPYLCLQDLAGDLLCWVLSDGFAAGAHGYTVPAQRRRGLMRALTIMAARRSHGRGFPVYGHTATGNRGMQRLQEELGHRRLPGLCRFLLQVGCVPLGAL